MLDNLARHSGKNVILFLTIPDVYNNSMGFLNKKLRNSPLQKFKNREPMNSSVTTSTKAEEKK